MKLENPERLAKTGGISLKVISALTGAKRDQAQVRRERRIGLLVRAGLVRVQVAFLSFGQGEQFSMRLSPKDQSGESAA